MGLSSAPVVRTVAGLSVLTSVVALVVADVTGSALPIQTINLSVIAGGASAMAVLLHTRMPDNNLWRVLLTIGIVGPLAVVLYATAQAQTDVPGPLAAAVWLLDVALAVPWMLFVGLFPDGHRPVRRWPALVIAGAVLLAALSVLAWLTAPTGAPLPIPGHLPGAGTGAEEGTLHATLARAASAMAGLIVLVGAWCLALRYRRAGPVVRQQVRVGAAGLTASVALELALRALPGVHAGRVDFVVAIVAVGVGSLGVAAALLRWRLWVVDQALPRAVVLGVCSAAFTAVIVAAALIITGRVRTTQVRGAVLAALLVTVLVQGYSRRLEPRVRRFVYGERPGGFAVLVGLADGLTSLDDQAAAARIADAARSGLTVPWSALWAPTARDRVYRLVARSGTVDAAEVVVLPPSRPVEALAARLLPVDAARDPFPPDTAALAVLAAEDEGQWGLLAVGQRPREPLRDGDLELLAAIAREAELAHVNRRLHREVAATMDELRTRAEQLQESRQRLVAAQDEERRRIERDLHDGAQHDLIALAGRLRQLARGSQDPSGALEGLADQAEQAVFSLQDLARGIYPSVLTDHGVAAAIRSHVGRLPMDVVLETAPEVGKRRWAPELEVAIYFVAVESLGNSRKHSGATTTTVTLAERDHSVVLEVHDNGVGFDSRSTTGSSGLQHMSDRMAALGGTLAVVSQPGGGTWVIATAPLGGRAERTTEKVSVR